LQIQFKDPRQEWELVNSWFVKQQNFTTLFKMRDIVKPEGAPEAPGDVSYKEALVN
jgi:hypothetical protein